MPFNLRIIHRMQRRQKEIYSAYLFDFDYTLGDATNGIVESVNYALEQMHFEVYTKDDIKKTVGMHLSDTYTHLTKDDKNENRARFIQLFKKKADEVMVENTSLYADTEKVLYILKGLNIKTAIVTTKYHYRITEILNKFKISHLIDVIIGGEDVKNSKPHPESIEMALRLLNRKPQNCLYVGDSLIDAETAFNSKLDFIAVTTGTTPKEEFVRFPYVRIVSCLSELTDFTK